MIIGTKLKKEWRKYNMFKKKYIVWVSDSAILQFDTVEEAIEEHARLTQEGVEHIKIEEIK